MVTVECLAVSSAREAVYACDGMGRCCLQAPDERVLAMTDGRFIDSVHASDLEKSIADHLGGYHRCYLEDPIHVEFMSDNLCSMLGYEKSELADLVGGCYTAVMHPDDVVAFDEFVCRLAEADGCESLVYRLVKRDGSIARVADTMASVTDDEGITRGYSVVCEIPEDSASSRSATSKGRIALVKVFGDSGARIEQMNEAASKNVYPSKNDLGGEVNFMDFVAVSDRVIVRKAIEQAYVSAYSGAENVAVVSADGKAFRSDLWVDCIQPGKSLEDSLFCIKLEIEPVCQKESEAKLSFSKQLFSSFAEDVFEVDRAENSVKYICRNNKGLIDIALNVRVFAEDFKEMFLDHVSAEDRERVNEFYIKAMSPKSGPEGSAPTKIRFVMAKDDGAPQPVALVMVPVSSTKYFMCVNSQSDSITPGFSSATAAVRKIVFARLFGSFSVMVDGEAVFIRCEKARELLALLIERRGAFVTTREAITLLWECEPDDKSRARYRKIASRLMAELRKDGIEYIVESDRGARRIVPEYIDCDYYDYRDGLKTPTEALLPEYTWSEYIRID